MSALSKALPRARALQRAELGCAEPLGGEARGAGALPGAGTALARIAGFSFRDYVVAEHAVRTSARGEESLRWWLERIQALPAALSLPMRSSHPLRRARMNCTALRLCSAQWAALAARARLLGLSPSALFYGVLAEGWACWSSARHFVLSILVSRRLPVHASVSSVLGSYYSVFPLEVDWLGGRFLAQGAGSRGADGRHLPAPLVRGRRRARAGQPPAREDGAGGAPVRAEQRSGDVEARRRPGRADALANHVHLCYDTPQTLVDVIVNPAPTGAVVLTYMASNAAFPAGLHGGILRAVARLSTRLARDADCWLSERPLPPAEDERPAIGRCGRATSGQTIERGLLCDAPLRRAAAHPPPRRWPHRPHGSPMRSSAPRHGAWRAGCRGGTPPLATVWPSCCTRARGCRWRPSAHTSWGRATSRWTRPSPSIA